MNIDLVKQLIQRFPNYGIQDLSYGIETDDGWYQLILDTLQEFENNQFEGSILQVKEKFGGLRIYVNFATDAIYDILNEAEGKSVTICERCGKTAELRNKSGWLITLCDDCFTNK